MRREAETETVISLEEFNQNHTPPACNVVGGPVILNSGKDDPASGLPEPEIHPEGKKCLTHRISGVVFVRKP